MQQPTMVERQQATKAEARQLIYFSLGLALKDIPTPAQCSYCGAPMQKEFLQFETTTPSLIVSATPTPGYGCTGCGLKEFPPDIHVNLLQRAACEAHVVGDIEDAHRLDKEARWIYEEFVLQASP